MYSILPYGFGKAVFWKQPGPGKDWAAVTGNWSYIYAVSKANLVLNLPTICLYLSIPKFIDYNDFFA